jgi:predicted exporter
MNVVWWALGGALAGATVVAFGIFAFWVMAYLGGFGIAIGAGLGLALGTWKGMNERRKKRSGQPPQSWDRPFY